jgi:hypothetical protein
VGTPVQVEIDAEEHRDVVLIPTAAIVREGEETAVMIVAGEKAQRRAIVLGLSNDMRTEVRSGITVGAQDIDDGPAGLPDGASVTLNKGGKGEGGKGKGGEGEGDRGQGDKGGGGKGTGGENEGGPGASGQ